MITSSLPINYGLLCAIAACYFELLGFPGLFSKASAHVTFLREPCETSRPTPFHLHRIRALFWSRVAQKKHRLRPNYLEVSGRYLIIRGSDLRLGGIWGPLGVREIKASKLLVALLRKLIFKFPQQGYVPNQTSSKIMVT